MGNISLWLWQAGAFTRNLIPIWGLRSDPKCKTNARDSIMLILLPPIPFFVASFTHACHNLLLQVREREALESLIGGRGREKLHTLPRKGTIRRNRRRTRVVVVRHSQARNVVLKHIRHVFEPSQIQQRPRSQLQRFVEPRIDRQSRVEKVQRWSDLALFLRRYQTPSVSHVFLYDLQKTARLDQWKKKIKTETKGSGTFLPFCW